MRADKKYKFFLFIIIVFLVVSFLLLKKTIIKRSDYFVKNNTTIYLEVAQTNSERKHGLMERKFMPENHGMMFIFPKAEILRFWMKNTLIPLDMIFLNKNQVVEIFNDVAPCKKETNPCPSYGPDIQADKVIELNAGMAKKLDIHNGDIIFI